MVKYNGKISPVNWRTGELVFKPVLTICFHFSLYFVNPEESATEGRHRIKTHASFPWRFIQWRYSYS